MPAPAWPVPADERARLAELRSYEILDTRPEPAWEDVARLAAQACGTACGLVSFLDSDREWAKAAWGLPEPETPRAGSFAARVITREDDLLVVPDAAGDPAWAEHPLVAGDPALRFYAGAAIRSPLGLAVGTVAAADPQPRDGLAEGGADALHALARQAGALLELRRRERAVTHADARGGHLAVQDELTGVANRILLSDRLGHALARAERSKRLVAVLCVDLDGFGEINEAHGEATGDLVLVHAARRLRRALRPMDTVARLEADSFVLVCEELFQVEHTEVIATRVEQALRAPVPLSDAKVELAASVGGVAGRFGDASEDLIRRAEEALRDVKHAGREPR